MASHCAALQQRRAYREHCKLIEMFNKPAIEQNAHILIHHGEIIFEVATFHNNIVMIVLMCLVNFLSKAENNN